MPKGERTPPPLDASASLIEFAAAASHDLSTPLQLISGYAELLAERLDGSDPEAVAALDGIRRGTERMRGLVDGLLAYARLGDELPAQRVDSGAVLADAIHALAGEVEATGATIEVPDAMPEVLAIPGQLYQLFHNLLSNALKFRSDEPPRIVVACEEEPGVWHFAVSDNGIGISEQDAVTIFDLFRRSRAVKDRPGTGIGLAIAKGIVERHGGKIWVHSAPGAGSTFHFTLPRRLRRRQDPPVAGDGEPGAAAS